MFTEIAQKLQQQIALVTVGVGLAITIGIPIGITAVKRPALKQLILSTSAVLWTIPSLALLALLIPLLGIGFKPAIVALTIYALLPIIRSTVAGIDGVSSEVIEAAHGLGFTKRQQLRLVELPLAMPVIVHGIRTATVMTVGIATLAAFIGAGGLGDFINRGLAMNSSTLLFMGAIPAALLALVLDFLIARIEQAFTLKQSRTRNRRLTLLTTLLLIATLLPSLHLAFGFINHNQKNTVVIATKNFTEQYILGELMSQLISTKTKLHVIKKFNLGTTAICQQAMRKGEIDIYPEYTGTAYMTVLHQSYQAMPATELFERVNKAYQQRFNITWLKPFGFNNSQALAINQDYAQQQHITTISDLVPYAPQLTIGAPAEFLSRPDAMARLVKAYRLQFGNVVALDPGLMYSALKNRQVNVIMAFSTDGRIPSYHLVLLKDDKQAFPSYDAAPLIRTEVLQQYPQIAQALKPLLGLINNRTMQQLNYQVDIEGKSPAQVAKNFLQQHKLDR